MTTVEFAKNFHSYKLVTRNTFNVIDHKLLLYREPFDLCQGYSKEDWYLVPKYSYVF